MEELRHVPARSIAIERTTQAVYDASLSELEKQWIEYCKKR